MTTRSAREDAVSRPRSALRPRFAELSLLERGEADLLFEAQLVVVREAIQGVFHQLQHVLPSERTDELLAWVLDCWQEAEQWAASPPTDREQDALMKRILAVHVAVTKLERDALLAVVKGSVAAR
jgi:hypothetical protein